MEWLKTFIYDYKGNCVNIYDYQKQLLNVIDSNKNVKVIKSRQVGLSSLMMNYIAKEMITGDGKTIVIVTGKLSLGSNQKMYVKNLLEKFSFIKILKDTKDNLTLSNGNRLLIKTASEDSFRGFKCDLVYFDEITDVKKILSVVGMLKLLESKIVIGSSIIDSRYLSFFNDENSFYKFKIHYSLVPHFVEEKMNEIKFRLGDSLFNMEYEMVIKEMQIEPQLKKDVMLNIRIDKRMESLMLTKLIELNLSPSDYIRKLIEKDLDN